MPKMLKKVVVLTTTALILAGCSSVQDSPAHTLEAAYEDIATSQFADLCDLIDPRTAEALSRLAGDCQTAMASDFSPSERAALADVEVDATNIDVQGDVARVTPGSVTSATGDVTKFKVLVKRNGKWWIAR